MHRLGEEVPKRRLIPGRGHLGQWQSREDRAGGHDLGTGKAAAVVTAIDRMAGVPAPRKSLTVKVTSYVPGTSGTKLARGTAAPEICATLPDGRLVNVQAYAMASVSGSVLPLPLKDTVWPPYGINGVAVKTAVGARLVLLRLTLIHISEPTRPY